MELERHGPLEFSNMNEDISAIFNPGVVECNGVIYLLPRVVKSGYTKINEGGYKNYVSKIWLAKSSDGKKFTLSDRPFIKPDEPYDVYGCEDPRVTRLYNKYFITYTALSEPALSGRGQRIGLASTNDFSEPEKHGIIGPDVNDKDAVIFPDEIDGRIGVLHRIEPHIQIMYFYDIEQLKKNHDDEFWNEYIKELQKHVVLDRRYEWESRKIGAGPPPIKTKEGWMLIYHGVDENNIYRVGTALLDLDDPRRVIARSPYPILEPEIDCELKGDVDNVVFPEGVIIRGDELFVYYGAADRICCLAKCELGHLIDFLLDECHLVKSN